jgi:hypothetical protein
VLHLQKVVRGALNMLADLVPMSGSVNERSQDKHVERSLQ